MEKKKTCLHQKKQPNYLISNNKHLLDGQKKEISSQLEPKEDIEDILEVTSLKTKKLTRLKKIKQAEEKSVIVESQLENKKKIWKDKKSSLDLNTQIMKLYQIMDQDLTLKKRALKPFWTEQSKEISKKLWLPTKIDYVDSVLSSSKESSLNKVEKSWFSIMKKHHHKKNLSTTSSLLSQFSLPESMDSEVMNSKTKLKTKLKTIKFRLFPTQEEKNKIHKYMDQFRWYYNTILTIVGIEMKNNNIKKSNHYSYFTFNKLLRNYEYVETREDGFLIKDLIKDENRNKIPIPEWWLNDVHSRVPRGAVFKFTTSLNSATSNLKNGNIKSFNMNYMTKKSTSEFLYFEDCQYPSFINSIKSRYWFKNHNRKRKTICLKDIINNKKGCEIIYDKVKNRYFLHYPVPIDWHPDDIHNDNQIMFKNQDNNLISLDPGIRKFLVGYDPSGSSVFIGEGARVKLGELLIKLDKLKCRKKSLKMWLKIKNLINDLHWRTISYLTKNYDIILLPEFRTQEMIKKKKLSRSVKRLMNIFSFYKFKEKLKWKCDNLNKKLIIVDESYTSCTCSNCGLISRLGSKELLNCSGCEISIDRDINGSRNILIKNLFLKK